MPTNPQRTCQVQKSSYFFFFVAFLPPFFLAAFFFAIPDHLLDFFFTAWRPDSARGTCAWADGPNAAQGFPSSRVATRWEKQSPCHESTREGVMHSNPQ